MKTVIASEVVYFEGDIAVACVPDSEEEQDIGQDAWARKALAMAQAVKRDLADRVI